MPPHHVDDIRTTGNASISTDGEEAQDVAHRSRSLEGWLFPSYMMNCRGNERQRSEIKQTLIDLQSSSDSCVAMVTDGEQVHLPADELNVRQNMNTRPEVKGRKEESAKH